MASDPDITPTAVHRYAGSQDPHRELDLFLPEGAAPRSLIVYAHGGSFLYGNRRDRLSRTFVARLVAQGHAFATVGYRRGGRPRRAFTTEMQTVIARAHARSTNVFPSVNPLLLGPLYYRALKDFSDSIVFLRRAPVGVALGALPVIVLGFSAGGTLALSLGHPPEGMEGLERPDAALGISSIHPQPWRLRADGPPLALLNARGDEVFPRAIFPVLEAAAIEAGAELTLSMIPYGRHNRPIRDLRAGVDAKGRPWFNHVERAITRGMAAFHG
jgi:hypothetical protein